MMVSYTRHIVEYCIVKSLVPPGQLWLQWNPADAIAGNPERQLAEQNPACFWWNLHFLCFPFDFGIVGRLLWLPGMFWVYTYS